MLRSLLLSVMCVALAFTACTNVGKFVWVDQYQEQQQEASPASDGYVIGPGDVLSVRVFDNDNMSAPRIRVQSDGKISLPFLNDMEAAGYTPATLAERLQQRLKHLINQPIVTVSVEERMPCLISVLGEVTRPGLYPLEACGTVPQALASAGGLTPFGFRDRIFVLRSTTAASPARIRFSYDMILRAEGPAARFRLRNGDVLVVE